MSKDNPRETAEQTLQGKLQSLARSPVLLVASDYDGTLAPIVNDPAAARPNREAIVALRTLAGMPNTHVAVISGRALRDLAELSELPDEVHLVGSHGSEFDRDFHRSLDPALVQLKKDLRTQLEQIAATDPGLLIEDKPASLALHYRNARPESEKKVLDAILRGPGSLAQVNVRHGKKVVELMLLPTHKGDALERIRARVGASAVLFLGDDRTDEDAFETLTGPDMGIKIGDGETAAEFRIDDTTDVARLLAEVCELRYEWLETGRAVAIEQHAMLSDLRTCALLTPDARLTWLCLPRIDSPALFADLLGGPTAGYFSIRPLDNGEHEPLQQYEGDSFVLETRWPSFTVRDFLDCSDGRPHQRAGRSELVRIVEGSGEVAIEFAPRLDYSRVSTRLEVKEWGLQVGHPTDPVVLYAPGVEWQILQFGAHDSAHAVVKLDPGTPLILELRYGMGPPTGRADLALDRARKTREFWEGWATRLTLPRTARELCKRSALTLKALVYGPSGAFSAAATTSLPEHVGGTRNWDYRYCWLRDAAMSAHTLVQLGSITEAMQYLDWVLGVVDRCFSPERLRPLYTVTGSDLPPEAEITELPGYRSSRPVRVGNSASMQVQLDVFGPIVDLIFMLLEHDAPLSGEHWRLVTAMVQAVERRWEEPDHGIWEIRADRRHHVHSKAMCWLTADRAVKIAHSFIGKEPADWVTLRDTIAAEIHQRGFHPSVHA
ncbi:MAG: trehalose-phosphatase, partial [Candidatus Eisenbacteria bacterium]|nr:trehalose-phosphatase [Candidatus Eisenbacteria bacterium]